MEYFENFTKCLQGNRCRVECLGLAAECVEQWSTIFCMCSALCSKLFYAYLLLPYACENCQAHFRQAITELAVPREKLFFLFTYTCLLITDIPCLLIIRWIIELYFDESWSGTKTAELICQALRRLPARSLKQLWRYPTCILIFLSLRVFIYASN